MNSDVDKIAALDFDYREYSVKSRQSFNKEMEDFVVRDKYLTQEELDEFRRFKPTCDNFEARLMRLIVEREKKTNQRAEFIHQFDLSQLLRMKRIKTDLLAFRTVPKNNAQPSIKTRVKLLFSLIRQVIKRDYCCIIKNIAMCARLPAKK